MEHSIGPTMPAIRSRKTTLQAMSKQSISFSTDCVLDTRKAKALRAIYRKDGIDLAEDEAAALSKHLRNKPLWSVVLCVVLLLVLGVFLVVRFLL